MIREVMLPKRIMSTSLIISALKLKLGFQHNIQNRIHFRYFLNTIPNTSKQSNSSETNLELKPFKENERDVWIGPPDPASNLRLKVFPQSQFLSEEEKDFYSRSKEVQDWNQQYWTAHNKDFSESRKMYISKVSKEKDLPKEESLSPEDMSIFYKEFLDRNRLKHIKYNWNWYRKNVSLICLAAKINLIKFQKTIMKSVKLKS